MIKDIKKALGDLEKRNWEETRGFIIDLIEYYEAAELYYTDQFSQIPERVIAAVNQLEAARKKLNP